MQVANTKNPSLGGIRIGGFGRTGMADISGGGSSSASVTNAGSKVYSNASSRPKNRGDESDSELESDDDDDIIIIYHSDFNSCSNKIKTWQYAYAYMEQQQQQQQQTTECMDAVNDVYEKIRMKQMKQAREIHGQQQQQSQYEIRDPHGILYLLRSRL